MQIEAKVKRKVGGKVVVITGASQGTGRAIARLFWQSKANVALVSRSKNMLKAMTLELPGSLAIVADLRKPRHIRRMCEQTIKHFGKIDILVNNAAQGMYGPVELVDIELYMEIFELNVLGPLRAMQVVIPFMREQGGGVIVNVSKRPREETSPGMSAYDSTKQALNSIAFAAKRELVSEKIFVGVVYEDSQSTPEEVAKAVVNMAEE